MAAGSGVPANLWWWLAAAGVGLALLAYVIGFFTHLDDMRDEDKAAAIMQMLGFVLFNMMLALMAVLQTAWHTGARIAMLLGAGYFTMMGAAMTGMFRGLFGGLL